MFPQNSNFSYGFHAEQGTDPNSPDTFKQNLQITLDHVARLREHARRALAGIKGAYHVGRNPSQTQQDIVAATETLAMIVDFVQKTGIGALPLLDPNTTQAPKEAQLLENAAKGVQVNFETLKKAQESAAVVANLLGSESRVQKP